MKYVEDRVYGKFDRQTYLRLSIVVVIVEFT